MKTSIHRQSTITRNLLLCALVAGAAVMGCTVQSGGHQLDTDRQDTFGSGGAINGTTFVHLFEWQWPDIAAECEDFLGPKGFAAVQVSPPNEHLDYDAWWARYQPVSYKLESRSGTRAEFIDMVQRCNAAGVGVIADLVINHTADMNGGGVGTGGTVWTRKNHPDNPTYTPSNYHSECAITNYQDAWNVQNCELVNLPDLDTSQDYVQNEIAAYIQDLINIGVAGFRIDAAKHIAPADIQGILAKAGNPDVFLEVIGAAGEAVQPSWYTGMGRVTEFGYGAQIGNRFLYGEIKDLNTIADGKLASDNAIVFTDNHDNQRGHGAGGDVVTFNDGSLYNIANAFMLAWPYGYPKVMSSYHFDNTDAGPPPGGTNCANPAFVCEHRWTTIANMVEFRNVTDGQGVSNWWTNGYNRIAFSRGNQGFVAINKESGTMNESLQTGMPQGTYCNIANGDFDGTTCTGSQVTVGADGYAQISVPAYEALAIHAGTQISGDPGGNPGDGLVDFTCYNGTTYFGQSVYVVGSIPEIGNWDPASAVKLDPTSYPTWTGTIDIGVDRYVEWKCVKRDEVNPTAGVEWQPGGNNILQTPSSGSTTSSGSF